VGSVTHLPVAGRLITKEDYAEEHVLDLEAADIEEALGYVPLGPGDIPPPPDLGPYATDADLAAGLATKANALLVIEAVSAASYTIQPSDIYAAKALTNAALVTVVVPNDPAIPVGARCRFGAEGAAGALVAEALGVTIINRGNKRAAAQGSIFELHKRSAAVWWLLGDVQ